MLSQLRKQPLFRLKRHPRNTYSHPGVKEPIWLPLIHQPYFMVVKGEVVALREKIEVY